MFQRDYFELYYCFLSIIKPHFPNIEANNFHDLILSPGY